MKRKVSCLFALCLVVLTSVLCFVACGGGTTTAKLVSATETQIVMEIEKTDGVASAFDALKSLREQGKVVFEYSESEYGAYIHSINGKAEKNLETTATSSKGYAWTLYTSDADVAYMDAGLTITVGETVCGQSSMGASALKVKESCLYVWVYEYYEYSW